MADITEAELDALTAAVMALARHSVPPDWQEALLRGTPGARHPIRPGALRAALEAARGVHSDPKEPKIVGARVAPLVVIDIDPAEDDSPEREADAQLTKDGANRLIDRMTSQGGAVPVRRTEAVGGDHRLSAGVWGRQRNGKIVGPLAVSGGIIWPFGDGVHLWHGRGWCVEPGVSDCRDIVELIDPPEEW